MDKVTFFLNDFDGVEYAIVDKGDGSFQSMTKEHYEKLLVEQSTQSSPSLFQRIAAKFN